MKLKNTITAMSLATLFVTMGASAIEKNIVVTASVDPSIDLLQADGTALPGAVELTYSPATKAFEPYSINTAVHTNESTKGVVVKLSTEPKLTNILDSSKSIPMEVTWGDKKLSTANTTIAANELDFGAAGVSGVSSNKLLTIQAKNTDAPSAGNYQGMVSIILTQSTTASVP